MCESLRTGQLVAQTPILDLELPHPRGLADDMQQFTGIERLLEESVSAASDRFESGALRVAAGRFRQDLFFRLNVVPLTLPPLRERQDDIPLLAAHFAGSSAAKYGQPNPELEPGLIEILQEYEWPGNVRELENLIERLVVLSSNATLGLEFVPEKMLRVLPGTKAGDESTLEGAVEALKKRMIKTALHSEGNKVAAAKKLGISRSYLHRLINEFDI
jgi:transcriptional regulator with PAS, ATPase and Fis domain